jgi:hypothetical protein
MPNICVKPYSNETSPLSQKESPYSKKNSPFSKKENPLSNKQNLYSERCLDYTAKVFQEGTPFVFQNGEQYILNLS